jgi:hypothetical protein
MSEQEDQDYFRRNMREFGAKVKLQGIVHPDDTSCAILSALNISINIMAMRKGMIKTEG